MALNELSCIARCACHRKRIGAFLKMYQSDIGESVSRDCLVPNNDPKSEDVLMLTCRFECLFQLRPINVDLNLTDRTTRSIVSRRNDANFRTWPTEIFPLPMLRLAVT